jgi:hypothetical protein
MYVCTYIYILYCRVSVFKKFLEVTCWKECGLHLLYCFVRHFLQSKKWTPYEEIISDCDLVSIRKLLDRFFFKISTGDLHQKLSGIYNFWPYWHLILSTLLRAINGLLYIYHKLVIRLCTHATSKLYKLQIVSKEILCTLWSTTSPGLFETAMLIQITNSQFIILNILFTFFKKKKTMLTGEYNEVNKRRKTKYNKINNNSISFTYYRW